MEIKEKLLKYKHHVIITLVASLMLVTLFYIAPRFPTILAYFWPLFVSTALFLATVIFFGDNSLQTTDEKAGEELLDYVAGQPHERAVENFNLEE